MKDHPLMSMDEAVLDFHIRCGLPLGEEPTEALVESRIDLLDEECDEAVEALRALQDTPESQEAMAAVLKELADIVVICHGTAATFGRSLWPMLEAVNGENLRKVGGTIRASDGKLLKPEGWRPGDYAKAERIGKADRNWDGLRLIARAIEEQRKQKEES